MKTIILFFLLSIPLLALGDEPCMSPTIQEVKKQHEAQFLKMPGVVSVGIGLDANGNQAIILGIDGSHPETRSSIPSAVDGFPVVVQNIGSIKAQ